jgi:glycerol-3-phosphate dehydrogenase
MPAGARTIVGTTDTDWVPDGQAPRPPRLDDRIRARGHDVRYLLEAVGHGFPSLALGPADVVSTYAALRPLLATNANTPSETSREHEIIRGPAGVLTVVGGKLTTLRRMGEETVDAVIRKLHAAGFEGPLAPCATAITPLPGGDRADRIAALAATDPTLAERIVPDLPYVWAATFCAAVSRSSVRPATKVSPPPTERPPSSPPSWAGPTDTGQPPSRTIASRSTPPGPGWRRSEGGHRIVVSRGVG